MSFKIHDTTTTKIADPLFPVGFSEGLTSSNPVSNAIRIYTTAPTGGLDVDTGMGGVDINTTGGIQIASSESSDSAIVFTASDNSHNGVFQFVSGLTNPIRDIFIYKRVVTTDAEATTLF